MTEEKQSRKRKSDAGSDTDESAAKRAKTGGAKPIFLFAHGAGADSSSDWMVLWAKYLSDLGDVFPFDYPYMKRGKEGGRRGAPDRLPKLIEAHGQELSAIKNPSNRPVFLIGKSMGSRVGCHLSLERSDIAGVITLGYPLVGSGSGKNAVRDEVLLAMSAPLLFVSGDRDKMAPIDMLNATRKKMTNRNELFVVATGDHSLAVLKKSGVTQDESDAAVMKEIARFVNSLPENGAHKAAFDAAAVKSAAAAEAAAEAKKEAKKAKAKAKRSEKKAASSRSGKGGKEEKSQKKASKKKAKDSDEDEDE